jgi:hypothetical protein
LQPGVVGAGNGISSGSQVSVYIDIEKKVKRGMYDKACQALTIEGSKNFEGKRLLFIGNGISQAVLHLWYVFVAYCLF